MEVPIEFFQNGNFMGFYKLDERAIWVFHIGKVAGGFSNVSNQSMIIRLKELGLVKNETQARLSWAETYY